MAAELSVCRQAEDARVRIVPRDIVGRRARTPGKQPRKLLQSGIDPSHQAKLGKISRRVAKRFVRSDRGRVSEKGRAGRESRRHTDEEEMAARSGTQRYRQPTDRRDISAVEILIPLRKVEGLGNYETARRMRSTIGQVFRYAISTARAENDPTSGLKGALTAPVVSHRPAFTDQKAFGGLLRAIWSYDGQPETKAALQLMAYLYPRPGELRQADGGSSIWTRPSGLSRPRAPRCVENTESRSHHRPSAFCEDFRILTATVGWPFRLSELVCGRSRRIRSMVLCDGSASLLMR